MAAWGRGCRSEVLEGRTLAIVEIGGHVDGDGHEQVAHLGWLGDASSGDAQHTAMRRAGRYTDGHGAVKGGDGDDRAESGLGEGDRDPQRPEVVTRDWLGAGT